MNDPEFKLAHAQLMDAVLADECHEANRDSYGAEALDWWCRGGQAGGRITGRWWRSKRR